MWCGAYLHVAPSILLVQYWPNGPGCLQESEAQHNANPLMQRSGVHFLAATTLRLLGRLGINAGAGPADQQSDTTLIQTC
jgi:hypothetical protein